MKFVIQKIINNNNNNNNNNRPFWQLCTYNSFLSVIVASSGIAVTFQQLEAFSS